MGRPPNPPPPIERGNHSQTLSSVGFVDYLADCLARVALAAKSPDLGQCHSGDLLNWISSHLAPLPGGGGGGGIQAGGGGGGSPRPQAVNPVSYCMGVTSLFYFTTFQKKMV